MPEAKSNDEINLFQAILKVVYTIKKNFLLIMVSVVLGGAFGLIRYFMGDKVYENKMIVSSGILTNSYSKVLFDNVNRHLAEGNSAVVAKELGTDVSVVKKVKVLKIESVRKDDASDQSEKDKFLITAEVSDQQITPKLQDAILYYLENNEYVKIRVEMNRKTTQELLSTVDKEIAYMEDLKSKIASGQFFQAAKGNLMFDPTSVNTKIIELTERKLNYQNSLLLSNSVHVIEPFSIFDEQTFPKMLPSIVIGLMIGALAAGAILLIKTLRSLIAMAETEFGSK